VTWGDGHELDRPAKSVEILGDRWCLLLVRELLRGVDRFNELERSVPGISRSVLTQRLRHLEREGVVDRRVGADGRTTDYRLTDAGYELGAVAGPSTTGACAGASPTAARPTSTPTASCSGCAGTWSSTSSRPAGW